MAYLVRDFVWGTHPDHGIDGWMAKDHLSDMLFLPSDGLGVAHDTLEHFTFDGSMEDECMAFGSIYFIRGETNRMRNYERTYVTVGYSLAGDLSQMFRDNDFADLTLIPAPRKSENALGLFSIKAEMHERFLENVAGELRDSDGREEDVSMTYREAWFETAFAWMVKGYRAAYRRWNGHGHNHSFATDLCTVQHQTCDLFFQLRDEVNKYHKRAEEGETLKVIVNPLRKSYNIVRKDEYGYARDY